MQTAVTTEIRAEQPGVATLTRRGWRDIIRQGLFQAAPTIQRNSVWYAGLVVDPTDFSEQLAQLHASLEGADAERQPEPIEK